MSKAGVLLHSPKLHLVVDPRWIPPCEALLVFPSELADELTTLAAGAADGEVHSPHKLARNIIGGAKETVSSL